VNAATHAHVTGWGRYAPSQVLTNAVTAAETAASLIAVEDHRLIRTAADMNGQAFRTKANRLPEPLKGQVKAFSRQALHAWLLAFRHPTTHLSMRFEAPIPGDMEELVGGFRKL